MSRKEWRDIWREFCDVNDVPVILSTMHEYLHTPDHVTRSFKDDLDMKVGWGLGIAGGQGRVQVLRSWSSSQCIRSGIPKVGWVWCRVWCIRYTEGGVGLVYQVYRRWGGSGVSGIPKVGWVWCRVQCTRYTAGGVGLVYPRRYRMSAIPLYLPLYTHTHALDLTSRACCRLNS